MTAVICIDNNSGMMFNHRRQSRDSVVIQDVLSFADGKTVRIHTYSAPLFAQYPDSVCADDDYLSTAGEDDICFIENADPAPYADRISRLVLYRWNRTYPADRRMTLGLSAYTLTETKEFAGSSHEKITREVYVKC